MSDPLQSNPTLSGLANSTPAKPKREVVWQVAGRVFQRRAFWVGVFSFFAGLPGLLSRLHTLPIHIPIWATNALLILGALGGYATMWLNNLEAAQAAARVMESLNAHQAVCPGDNR